MLTLINSVVNAMNIILLINWLFSIASLLPDLTIMLDYQTIKLYLLFSGD